MDGEDDTGEEATGDRQAEAVNGEDDIGEEER